MVAYISWNRVAASNGSSTGGNLGWRFLLGFGCIPGLLVAPLRAKKRPTGAETHHGEDNPNKTSESFYKSLMKNKAGLTGQLLGTAGAWFLFDITFYANALFAPAVLEALFAPHNPAFGLESEASPAPTPYSLTLSHSSGVNESIARTLVTYSIGLPGNAGSRKSRFPHHPH